MSELLKDKTLWAAMSGVNLIALMINISIGSLAGIAFSSCALISCIMIILVKDI